MEIETKKKGRGRPAKDGAKNLVRMHVQMSEHQKAKLHRLGGSVWIRRQIDIAGLAPGQLEPGTSRVIGGVTCEAAGHTKPEDDPLNFLFEESK